MPFIVLSLLRVCGLYIGTMDGFLNWLVREEQELTGSWHGTQLDPDLTGSYHPASGTPSGGGDPTSVSVGGGRHWQSDPEALAAGDRLKAMQDELGAIFQRAQARAAEIFGKNPSNREPFERNVTTAWDSLGRANILIGGRPAQRQVVGLPPARREK
jgi:hypothetical protein